MLTFKEIANKFHLLRWIQQQLIFNSPLGTKKLASVLFCMSTKELNLEYDRMDRLNSMLDSVKGKEFYNKISHTISTFRDIEKTLDRIESAVTLSELELFEIKYFSYNYEYLSSLLQEYDLGIYEKENLWPVFQLLDPDRTGVTSFYIYDSYDSRLGELRKKIKTGDADEQLYQNLESVSYKVRENLSIKLSTFIRQLKISLDSIACWDLLIAKVVLARENLFCRPSFSEYGTLSYNGLYNPYLKFILESNGEAYQPIDVSLFDGPTVITGANMSGKTMALKSVALAQYLIQFGFYVPANKARVALTEKVMLLSGDTQDESKGLSSFGAEILAISDIVETVYQNTQVLVLLDEPARTTSPEEGVVIVDAILEILVEQKTMSLVTTHYNKLKTKCRCLRVVGFKEELAHNMMNCKNINRFVDYRLVNAEMNEGISEAYTVAKLLKVSNKLLMKIDSGRNKTPKESS